MRQGREAACFSVSSVMVFTLVQPEYMPAFLADDNLIVVTVVTGHLAVTVHFEVVDALLVIEICPKVFGDVRNVDLVDQSRQDPTVIGDAALGFPAICWSSSFSSLLVSIRFFSALSSLLASSTACMAIL